LQSVQSKTNSVLFTDSVNTFVDQVPLQLMTFPSMKAWSTTMTITRQHNTHKYNHSLTSTGLLHMYSSLTYLQINR